MTEAKKLDSEDFIILEKKIHESVIHNSNVNALLQLYGVCPYSLMFLTCGECKKWKPIEFSFIVQDQESSIIVDSIQRFLISKDSDDIDNLAFSEKFMHNMNGEDKLEFLCGTCLEDRGFNSNNLELPTCKHPEELYLM